jgi:peroxiredoxin
VTDPGSPSGRAHLGGALTVAAVLLASGFLGFVSYRFFRAPAATPIPAAQVQPVPPMPAIEPSAEALPAPAKVPDRLPDIQLPGTDGKVHRLADWKGKPLVVNFWATWCDPCRREIPLLKELRREHAKDGVEIVGIALDYADKVSKYASDHRITYPLLLGDEGGLTAVTAFGMEAVLPFTVFADRDGRVVTLKVGELHRDEAELILAGMGELEAGRLSLPAAQAQISAGIRQLREARAGRE